jgi:hypothetical protein
MNIAFRIAVASEDGVLGVHFGALTESCNFLHNDAIRLASLLVEDNKNILFPYLLLTSLGDVQLSNRHLYLRDSNTVEDSI